MTPTLIDLTGETFGRLTVARRHPVNDPRNKPLWTCTCQCGNVTVVSGSSLRSGLTLSCGCLRDEAAVRNGKANATHGMDGTPEYQAWVNMRRRCTNPNQPNYRYYGGRGISVCDRWLDFQAFYDDLGPRPSPEHSLDRIDNDGNYEPGNVRWGTRSEQNINKRRRAD